MIYFSDFSVASGPTGDGVVAVQDFATGTSTGSQNFTSGTITGITPKAAIVFGGNHQIANDATETPAAHLTIGFTDGTNQYATSLCSGDNVASTATRVIYSNTQTLRLMNSASSTRKQATGSLISGGVALDFTTNNDGSQRHAFIAFAGNDVQAKVGLVAGSSIAPTLSVTGVGFQPDVLIFRGPGNSGTGALASLLGTFGVATKDGAQRCVVMAEDNAAAAGQPLQAILTDCVTCQMIDDTGALVNKIVASNFGSDGFDLTRSPSAGTHEHIYLALKFTGRKTKIVDFTTPTSTGLATHSGAGFTPQFALMVLTSLEATDPTFPISTSDLMSGLSISAIGDEQWSTSMRIDSGADPTDTGSLTLAGLLGASATSCKTIIASLDAFTSDGVRMNYSAVAGAGKKGFILFVE